MKRYGWIQKRGWGGIGSTVARQAKGKRIATLEVGGKEGIYTFPELMLYGIMI